MRTAGEIYAAYDIMPNLQLHQLRVAAVGKIVCEDLKKPANKNDVILASLFHDMGNVIKSDLTIFPDFREEKGLEYWESVKTDFVRRYGNDAHRANVAIASELRLPAEVVRLIDGIGFSRLGDVLASDSFELKILEYADTRVGPRGVLSVQERLTEARARYDVRIRKKEYYERNESFTRLSQAAHGIEKQIFEHTAIAPEDINDSIVDPLTEELRRYPVA